MDTVDRNYVEFLIEQAKLATRTARDVAEIHGMADVAEKLSWALDFQRVAAAKAATGTNADGTYGPSHIIDTERELLDLRQAHEVHVQRDGDLPVSCPVCQQQEDA